jgi:hypothetical protein
VKYGSAREYDRAKRSAAIRHATKHHEFGEIDANDPDIDDATRDRVAKAHFEYKAQIEGMNAAETKARKEAEARATAHTLRANKVCMLMEWRSLGCEIPERWREKTPTTIGGKPVYLPTMSPSFLFSMGWRIGQDEQGNKVLYLPPPKPQRKTREEWEREWAAAQEDELKATLK